MNKEKFISTSDVDSIVESPSDESPRVEQPDATRKRGLKIERYFTNSGKHPFDEMEWEHRDAVIYSENGDTIFEQKDVEVPKSWSQLATDIATSKYLRKAGVPDTGNEVSMRQLVTRVVKTIRSSGDEIGGYFATHEDAESFEAELTHLLISQRGAFNSPVWFNCGLWHEYGIKGSSGSFYWDRGTKSAKTTTNAYQHPQNSACFIQSVDDSLDSMLELQQSEVRLFKHGSGTGTNFSKIRAKGEWLLGGGTSSGVISFLEGFDRWAGSIKSGGTTRRAAKMVILDMDHPEIADFIDWKLNEERKAQVLIAAGYESDFNSEAYHTVSGQNSNNSVRIPDVFMDSYLESGKWNTTYRTNDEVANEYDTKHLMDKISYAAWACADPGVQFDGTIQKWNTCKNTDRINGTNPCSEFVFIDDTSCNLASINLVKFLNDDGMFDVEAYRHTIRIFIIAMDIIVEISSYPTDKIAKRTHDFRPLGLGYGNLGALLMLKGIPYDSEVALSWAGTLAAILSGHGYLTSTELASSIGTFEGFHENRSPMLDVIRMHCDEVYGLGSGMCPDNLITAAHDDWESCLDMGEQFGYRNSQISVIAPTGTISFLMDYDTTGIEPDFALVKFKKLAGGGSFKIVNQTVPKALSQLDYPAIQIDEIVDYVDEHGTVEGAPYLKKVHYPIFDCANKCGRIGTRFIEPMGHVRMMAAVQPFISGAISKTVNLPNDATEDDITQVYVEAWKLGVKCLAVYRDGSKGSQPLSSANQQEEKENRPVRKRLPDLRDSKTHKFSIAGHEGYLTVGMYEDGRPGEVFLNMAKEGSVISGLMDTIALMTSVSLQHGIPLEFFIDKFSHIRFEPSGFTGNKDIPIAKSIIDYVFRWLGLQFLPDNQIDDVATMQSDAPPCHACGTIMTRSGTCYRCTNCGATSGCS